MNKNITYCTNKECTRKISCKRHISNYFITEKFLIFGDFMCNTTTNKRMDYYIKKENKK